MKVRIIVFFIFLSSFANAQKSMDLSVWSGLGTYLGDIKTTWNNSLSVSSGAFLRYNFNPRITFRMQIISGSIRANGLFDNQAAQFSKNVTNVAGLVEVNFLKYMLGIKEMPFTTYLVAGVGVGGYKYDYNYATLNLLVKYLNNPTINNSLGLDVSYQKNKQVLELPIGFGFKMNMGKSMALGMEFLLFKYLDDCLDDLDDPRKCYRKINTPVSTSDDIEWTSFNSKWHNNDYTLYAGIYLTFKINTSKKSCPVFDLEY